MTWVLASIADSTRDRELRTRRVDPQATRSTLRTDDALVGTVVAGLTIDRVLAEGGMGIVYAARTAAGASVALKVLQPRHANDVGLRSRFEREIAFMQRIDHPHVARVLERGELADGRPWFTTALEDGGATLGSLVRGAGPLDLDRALEIGCEVLAGLEAVHAAGIVHRDLQPDNVLLGARGVRIIDFGFAHLEGVDTGDGVTPDSPGALVGTLRFMSPEQATRSRALTVRSDLFTCALLVYYALTGKLPFRGRCDRNVMVSIVRSSPTPLRRERRDAPLMLETVLSRALAKHPDARYATAKEMRQELERVRAHMRP